MHFTLTDDFDAVKIAASGQCFRWYPLSDGRCRIFARDRTVVLKQTAPDTLELDCTPEEFQTFWHNYFDFATDYTAIRASIDPNDHYLSQSATCGQGIRILRQDPFEMLITFLLSQRKSIPAIQKSVEALSRAAGTPIGEADGQTLYAFPTPAQLATLDDDTLAACGLGYRLPYIRQAAQTAAHNPGLFDELAALDDAALREKLLSLHGVGPKIAQCVMLFGFHRMDSFPLDVWMNRVMDTHYPNGFPFDRYAPFNGVIQQYLFYFVRAERTGTAN